MKDLSLLIKPASSLCNMRCRYCFYEDEAENRMTRSMGVMQPEVTELLVDRAFSGLTARDSVTFAFQGGEPTLAGIGYFRHFVEAVERRNTARSAVRYAIQTNGLAIDGDWISLFKERRFLVGVSVDGDKALHDASRIDANGKGTWNRVSQTVTKLLRSGVEVDLLCVVTRQCARSPQRVYHALKKLGVSYLQFIACLDPIGKERGREPWSLQPEDYGRFLCGLFDAWYLDWAAGRYTSVRLFDDYVHLAMGLPAGTCATGGSCGAYCVVEGDGGVYPCDFYVLDEWRLGSLADGTIDELERSPRAVEFLREGERRPAECLKCQWQRLCNGGCRRDWIEDPSTGEVKNYYCTAFQTFFGYAAPRLFEIAAAER